MHVGIEQRNETFNLVLKNKIHSIKILILEGESYDSYLAGKYKHLENLAIIHQLLDTNRNNVNQVIL